MYKDVTPIALEGRLPNVRTCNKTPWMRACNKTHDIFTTAAQTDDWKVLKRCTSQWRAS
jgi:hypothetical protein